MSPTEPTAPEAPTQQQVDAALDGWMRRESAAVRARLIQRFGWSGMERVEDALQDALVRAIETWPFTGIPARPGGWLYTVALNRMRDLARSSAERQHQGLDELDEHILSRPDEALAAVGRNTLSDPELEVLLSLCHPALAVEARIALALQVMCGFTLREIAQALLMNPEAVAQRVFRAKRALRDLPDGTRIPTGAALRTRLAAALDVIALLFNEGFEPSSGDLPMRIELCAEALRLADALADHPLTQGPETRALSSLLNLLFARLPARLARPGSVTLLPEQDRSRWSVTHLRRGFEQLRASATGDRLSRYHLLAGIAATHAAAANLDTTDWDAIAVAYERLIGFENSPVHRLNFAVALLRAGQPARADDEIERLVGRPEMAGYFWFHVTRAEIQSQSGDRLRARAALTRASTLARTPAQAEIVAAKIAALERSPHLV